MDSITLTHVVDAPPEEVRELVADAGRFMRAAGFDEVEVDGSTLIIRNSVGLASLELECAIIDADCVLAYEQREGIFERMETRYELADHERGTEVTVTTRFAVDVALVGEILDATVVKRQRRREITSQFDYLDREAGG